MLNVGPLCKEVMEGQGGQSFASFWPGKLTFLKYHKGAGDNPLSNGRGPLSRGLEVIRKDTGEVPPAEVEVLLQLLLHIKSPLSQVLPTVFLNLWCLKVPPFQVASKRSS